MTVLWTITVDTEEEWDWSAGWPVHELSVTNIERLPAFQDRCSAAGAAVTYFANHAVVDQPQSAAILAQLAKRDGVEVGMHIHPWNTPPVTAEHVSQVRDTYLHNLPAGEIDAKLTSVYEAFARAGLPAPTSFRGGRYSTSPHIQTFLQRHGFVADSSIVPYTSWAEDGAPSFANRGLQPTRRAPHGPGESALWEVPLTRAFTRPAFDFWGRLFHTVEHSFLRRFKLIGCAQRLGLVRRVWLNFEQCEAEEMLALLPVLQAAQVPCIGFTLHSSSLLAGGSPYAPDEAGVARLLGRIEHILAHLRTRPGFEPATMSTMARRLEEHFTDAR